MQPKSSVPAFLEVCDIAGLVKGAAEVGVGWGGRCEVVAACAAAWPCTCWPLDSLLAFV